MKRSPSTWQPDSTTAADVSTIDSQLSRVGTLDINQDLDFQRRSWTAQRVSWGVMGLILIAAILGVFGSGPLSHTSVRAPQAPISLNYARFTRYLRPTTIAVHIDAEGVQSEHVRIWFTPTYVQRMTLQGITPPAEWVEVGTEQMTFVFRAAQPGQALVVSFHFQSQELGSVTGQVGVEQHPPLSLSQFVYP